MTVAAELAPPAFPLLEVAAHGGVCLVLAHDNLLFHGGPQQNAFFLGKRFELHGARGRLTLAAAATPTDNFAPPHTHTHKRPCGHTSEKSSGDENSSHTSASLTTMRFRSCCSNKGRVKESTQNHMQGCTRTDLPVPQLVSHVLWEHGVWAQALRPQVLVQEVLDLTRGDAFLERRTHAVARDYTHHDVRQDGLRVQPRGTARFVRHDASSTRCGKLAHLNLREQRKQGNGERGWVKGNDRERWLNDQLNARRHK